MESAGPEDIALITAYAEAAIRRDVDAAVAMYTFPAAFLSPRPTRVAHTPDDLRAMIAAAYAGYDAEGLHDIRLACGRALALGPDIRQVEVHWHVRLGDDGAREMSTWYVLRRTDAGWRISGSLRTA